MPLAIKARSGAGSGLFVGDGASPENFLKLAQVLTLKRSGKKQAQEKVTNQDSPMDVNGIIWEEILGTIASGGTIDATINLVPQDKSQQNLFNLFNGDAYDWQLQGPPDLSLSPVVPKFTWSFSAVLFDFPDIDLPVDKAMTCTVKLTVVGPDSLVFSEPQSLSF